MKQQVQLKEKELTVSEIYVGDVDITKGVYLKGKETVSFITEARH